jgi:hypothetical protein
MIQRSPAVDDLVRRLLEHEAGGARDADSLASAVERTCHMLSRELESLVGRGGVCALFGRAVGLSRREFPYLATIRPEPDVPLAFDALRESLRGRGAAEVEAAGTSLLANLLEVLVSLLGEDLGLRPVMSVWPILVPQAGSRDSREIEE